MFESPIEFSKYPVLFKEIKSSTAYGRTNALINKGKQVKNIVKRHTYPSGNDCRLIKDFLVEVESWKYGMEGDDCKPFYHRYISKNSESVITTAITHIYRSVQKQESDVVVLGHLNRLTGMGSVKEGNDTSTARQKLASSVLRILYPELYGVVDWRVKAVITGAIGSNSSLRKQFDVIDAVEASKMFHFYRIISEKVQQCTGEVVFPGDIESVLFARSLIDYPPRFI